MRNGNKVIEHVKNIVEIHNESTKKRLLNIRLIEGMGLLKSMV